MLNLTCILKKRSIRLMRAGFTLVEMLTVMAIIALLSLSVPAIQSAMTAGTFDSNASQVNDLLRVAYSAAIAKNTYVWIGLKQLPNNAGVGVACVYSTSGNTGDVFAANPSYLFKPVILKRLSLATITTQISDPNRVTSGVGQIYSGADNLTVPNPTSNASTAPVFTAPLGVGSQSISSYSAQSGSAVIEITPSGQVSISANKYAWVEIGMRPVNGNAGEAAVLQMNCFTGRIVQFLP